MRTLRLAVLIAMTALFAILAHAASGDEDIDITATGVGNFKVAVIDTFWTVSAVRPDTGRGLMLGVNGQPAECLGTVSHQYGTGTEPAPDAVLEAEVDLGDGVAPRSVTVRLQRDDDPDQITYARVAAWKEKRDATTTKVRLTVGARIKDGSVFKWRRADLDVPDNTTSGTLKLVVEGKNVTAYYPDDLGQISHPDNLQNNGSFISEIRVEMFGDVELLDPDPAVGTFSALPPP